MNSTRGTFWFRRRTLLWAAGIAAASGIGAITLWFVFDRVDWRAAGPVLANADVPYLVAATAFMLVAVVLRGLRWRMLLHGSNLSTTRLLLIENTAIGVNSLTPIPVLDEPTRVGLLRIQGIPMGTALATLAANRVFDLTAQAVIGLLGIAFLSELRSLAPYILTAAVGALAANAALFTIGPWMHRVPSLGRLPLVKDFAAGVHLIRSAPLRTASALLLTIAYYVAIGMSGWMLGRALDIPLSLAAFTVVSLLTIFLTDWVPGLPFAIGTFEFWSIHLLGLWDFDESTALGFAVLFHMVFFVPPILCAAGYLPYAGFRSVDALVRLMRGEGRASAASESPRRTRGRL